MNLRYSRDPVLPNLIGGENCQCKVITKYDNVKEHSTK